MYASPQDFLDFFGEDEASELFPDSAPSGGISLPLLEAALSRAWSVMVPYLHRYLPMPPPASPLLDYQVALQTLQLQIARKIGSAKAVPREQVDADHAAAIKTLLQISKGEIGLIPQDTSAESPPVVAAGQVAPRQSMFLNLGGY